MKKDNTKQKSVKKIQELEVDVIEAEKVTCNACELSHPVAVCPFCNRTGLILMAIAIVLVAINNTWTRYAAWVALLAAFLVPVIRGFLRKTA